MRRLPAAPAPHNVLTGRLELWWPPLETFLKELHLPISEVLELPPLAVLPLPAPINPACATFFNEDGSL
jgi:hypothetical protein